MKKDDAGVKMKKTFIVGSINTDLVIKASYIPESGETLAGSDFFVAHGGKGANQAIAAARLGGCVTMCGCVGNDSFGNEAIQSLKKEGINVSHIRIVKNAPSGTAMIIITAGDNRIILDKGANAALKKRDIDETLEEAKAGDIYLTQLENPIDIIGYGLMKAKEKGMYVILNPAPANLAIEPYLLFCDMIVPNESECALLGGKEKLLSKVPIVITTLGKNGYEISDINSSKKYSCIKIKVVDTTAAGDTLCGGMVARLSNGGSLEEAVRFGSVAASVACTKMGAQPSIPTESEVNKIF